MFRKMLISDAAIFVESHIFPVVFLFVSLKHVTTLAFNTGRVLEGLSGPDMAGASRFIMLSDLLIVLALVAFNCLTAYALLVTRNLRTKPVGTREILVPLIATFWYLTYNIIPYLPPGTNVLVLPRKALAFSVCFGSTLTLAGLAIASWSVVTLRKSFGIFVQVRDIVTRGLYARVRHPMYFGHLLAHTGFFFITPRAYALALSAGLVVITLYRARLEEKKLAASSTAYREYMKTTPFIIPHL